MPKPIRNAGLILQNKYLEIDLGNKDIPKHILGIDDDFYYVCLKIDWFMKLDEAEQKAEKKKWGRLASWEQVMCEKRIAALKQTQEEYRESQSRLIGNNPVQNPAQKRPRRSDSPVPEATRTVSPIPPAVDESNLVESDTIAGQPPLLQEPQEPLPIVNDTENAARLRGFFRPPSQTLRLREKRKQNQVNELAETPTEQLIGRAGDRTTGLFSSEEHREALADENKAISNSYVADKVHHRKQHARTIRQQRDKTSRGAINMAIDGTAVAIDTCFFDNPDAPRVKVAMFILNEVKDAPARGGAVADTDLVAEKKDFYVVCHSGRDLKAIMSAYKACTRVRGLIPPEYNLISLTANKDGYLLPNVQQYIADQAESRARPDNTPRSYTDTMNETPLI